MCVCVWIQRYDDKITQLKTAIKFYEDSLVYPFIGQFHYKKKVLNAQQLIRTLRIRDVVV